LLSCSASASIPKRALISFSLVLMRWCPFGSLLSLEKPKSTTGDAASGTAYAVLNCPLNPR
jgi:hypothetical protein